MPASASGGMSLFVPLGVLMGCILMAVATLVLWWMRRLQRQAHSQQQQETAVDLERASGPGAEPCQQPSCMLVVLNCSAAGPSAGLLLPGGSNTCHSTCPRPSHPRSHCAWPACLPACLTAWLQIRSRVCRTRSQSSLCCRTARPSP
jgi:hypothetical protein